MTRGERIRWWVIGVAVVGVALLATLRQGDDVKDPEDEGTGAAPHTRCPVEGSATEAFARPPGGARVVRAAQLRLPSGRIQESGGEALGRGGGKPVEVAAADAELGLYLVVGSGDRPRFAQLVIDPATPPARWARDERFGFTTDGGLGAITAPEAVAEEDDGALSAALEDWINRDDGSPCLSLPRGDGTQLVLYADGTGAAKVPGIAGRAADGSLVAVTWPLAGARWPQGGFPGQAPPDRDLAG